MNLQRPVKTKKNVSLLEKFCQKQNQMKKKYQRKFGVVLMAVKSRS